MSIAAASGYAEGYFGRLLTWEERAGLLEEMADAGLGAWLHAPKEDPLHRRLWRQPFEADWLRDFADFCRRASDKGIRVRAGVSPGMDLDFSNSGELEALCAKYRQLLEAGAPEIALLFDDLPLPPEQADAATATRQAELALRVLDALKLEPGLLAFCPTQYCARHAADGVADSSYLQALAEHLPAQTRIFWTGPEVISGRLDSAAVADVATIFADRLILWDNFYANDWAPRRLTLCPYRRRDAAAPLLLNPTGLPHTDGFYLRLLGQHLAGQEPEVAFSQALEDRGVPASFERVAPLFALERPAAAVETSATEVEELCEILRELAFGDWCSPLQREWFPFLQGCLQDLRLGAELAAGKGGALDLARLPPALRALVRRPK